MKTCQSIRLTAVIAVLTAALGAYAGPLHVDLNSTNPVAPYAAWSTAATDIQSAVDAAGDGDTILITNGIYAVTKEISVTSAITLESVNGPASVIVDGGNAVRCFNLGSSACTLEGFTIQNGVSTESGGGISCTSTNPVINNCIIRNNTAGGDYVYGGGIFYGTANNCFITANSTTGKGGGATYTALNNCTLTRNASDETGGGACLTPVKNCIVWNNTATSGNDNLAVPTFPPFNIRVTYTCSPDATHGTDGNITNAPLFTLGAHISFDSPCAGAGTNSVTGTDIDGDAWNNPPAIGCDEPSTTHTGPLAVELTGLPVRAFTNETVSAYANVAGKASRLEVDFGDGTIVTNVQELMHAWSAVGTYDVTLTAFNDDYPGGVSETNRIKIWEAGAPLYVAPGGNDANVGDSWTAAKATIQGAVDAQWYTGGLIYVTNGTYSVTNEITVTQAVVIQSVNGADVTVVDGGGTNRCFNLGSTSTRLDGFTVQNGYSSTYGGGIYCSSTNPVISNCIISGNSAHSRGGGIYYGTANRCIIINNTTSNSGGGLYSSTANNCHIVGNLALGNGGGMFDGSANNCIIAGNTTYSDGGGAFGGSRINCTITENSAAGSAGGASAGSTINCIVWNNTAKYFDNLYSGSTPEYTCSPTVTHGKNGNITNAPAFTVGAHIALTSPCKGAGTNRVSGTDIDGDPWGSPPSIGCDEPIESLTGPIELKLLEWPSLVIVGREISAYAYVAGQLSSLEVDYGDGHIQTHSPWLGHAWDSAGTYDIIVTAFNGDYPAGISATQQIEVVSAEASTIYVAVDGDDSNSGASWSEAKATIQAGVDAQLLNGGHVLVSNGTYQVTNEIVVYEELTIRSQNGPELTIVDGGGSNRCFKLVSNPCRLEGFTIQNGYNGNPYNGRDDSYLGGGVLCQNDTTIITNCIFQNNYAEYGGGLARGRAENCRFIGNTADRGAGIYRGNANDCLFEANKAGIQGGGMLYGNATHCTFQKNEALGSGGGMHGGTATYCIFETNMVTTGYGIASFYGGGGMSNGEATNCVFKGNSADQTYGGGASCSTVINCAFINNSALNGGGIAAYVSHYDADGPSKAVNCTFSGNSAGKNGGGIYWTESINSIIWDNTAVDDGDNIWQPHKYNYDYGVYSTEVRHTCSPDTIHGIDGNITNAPLLISDAHLASNSPCIGAGTNLFYGSDIDDEPWNNPPSMGCDEPAAAADRSILLYITGISDRVLMDYEMEFTLTVLGPCSGFCLDFGDGSVYRNCAATNYMVLRHHWEQTGPHSIVLTGYYSGSCDSVSITQQIEVVTAADAALYVSQDGSDLNAGTDWSTAKATIQAGVDAQMVPGGTVWLTNGTHLLTKQISIETPVVVQGLHGAEFTVVDGGQSNRCFNLNNAKCVLRDLTIQNGLVVNNEGGGIYCDDQTPVVESCIILSNKASSGGGMYQGTANNCVFKNNRAYYGGGMYEGMAIACLFEENAATSGLLKGGGGTAYGTANNCVFLGNTSTAGGGGTFHSKVANSVFIRNSAKSGGGMLSHNSDSYYGVPLSYAIHCTFLENHASAAGGGIYVTSATNCIAWNNTAAESGDNLKNFANVAYSCSPDLTHGENGNITNAPLMATMSHITSGSPCVGAGIDLGVAADIDGEAWGLPPSMGCDEPNENTSSYTLLEISGLPDRKIAGQSIDLSLVVIGSFSGFDLDFGDGVTVSNTYWLNHTWDAPGTYDVILTAVNHDGSAGASTTQQVQIISYDASPVYVAPDGNDTNAGISWATAKATIQAGAEAQLLSGGAVVVSNGTYHLTNEIFISNEVIVESLNGPETCTVDGGGSNRCFNLSNTVCTIRGFTIQNGSTDGYEDKSGGGIYCSTKSPIIENCVIKSNAADSGGGIYGGRAYDCTISHNAATYDGGGLYETIAYGCTISSNTARFGGGLCAPDSTNAAGKAYNCLILGNTVTVYGGGMYYADACNCTIISNSGGGIHYGNAFNCIIRDNTGGLNLYFGSAKYSCSPDLIHGANGNITNAPLFVDAAAGDYRLQSNSPCINWGSDAYVSTSRDLDGHPRIVGTQVDMGAYEYPIDLGDDVDGDGVSDIWEQTWFGYNVQPADNADGDRFSNGEEYIAGTDPTSSHSLFAVTNAIPTAEGFVVEWDAVEGRTYSIHWSDALTNSYQTIATNIVHPQSSFTDTVRKAESTSFYQVEVELAE